ncbi:MAG: DUF4954 family protein [Bacteroidales bacterium]|nr:DUF4954 family protein [Bacteroidales bacterium]
MEYRNLSADEISRLESQACQAADWSRVMVSEGFTPDHIFYTRFSGDIRLGSFRREFVLAGGISKHAGVRHATLHNVVIEDDCCIENVNNYISNYHIGHDSFIENVDVIVNDGLCTFGNGVDVAVMNETGGREVMIYDRLTAQQAYIMALYRHRPELIARLRAMIGAYSESRRSETGHIGSYVRIADTGYIKDVYIGDYAHIEGTARLYNGSINSNQAAPVQVGVGVIGDDFIICSGSEVKDNVSFSRCFIGQSCKLGHGYSASDSLFFSNCQGENGEACAIFAGPFTVTHHKSTLLIAGMFSFMNAGSGSNQSNHMYKLGPIHQGIMQRGSKTSSDSYILWPAKVGAFSLVMGRHVTHPDTSCFPFSYLMEQDSHTYIVPGANLKSVGTIRDARKWPKRDGRKEGDKLDCINFNLLSPFTITNVLKGIDALKSLQAVSGSDTAEYMYHGCVIRASSLKKGQKFYSMVMDKFLGNSLISRIQKSPAGDIESIRKTLVPDSNVGQGEWIDVGGMIAPQSEVDALLSDIESEAVASLDAVSERFNRMHSNYYSYEWTWASKVLEEYYGIDLKTVSAATLLKLIHVWHQSVIGIDNLLLEDAAKEFSLSMMTSFGADGSDSVKMEDFVQVRGAAYDDDPFVKDIREHIRRKTALRDEMLSFIQD